MAAVQKSAFMLSSATVMIGKAFDEDVYSLTPDGHSVGMVKEVSVPMDSSMITLANGVSQAIVASKRTGVQPTISFTSYEFTAQNVMRSLAMNDTAAVLKRGALKAALVGAETELTVSSSPIPGEPTSAIAAVGDIPSGSTLLIQKPSPNQDYVFPTKSSGAATAAAPDFTVPIAANYAIPAGMAFPADSLVWVVPTIKMNIDRDDLFCVKIVGTLDSYDRPVTVVLPKVKISRGFNLQFSETEYGGMPWEMQPLLMSATEATDRLADIGTGSFFDIYVGA